MLFLAGVARTRSKVQTIAQQRRRYVACSNVTKLLVSELLAGDGATSASDRIGKGV